MHSHLEELGLLLVTVISCELKEMGKEVQMEAAMLYLVELQFLCFILPKGSDAAPGGTRQ